MINENARWWSLDELYQMLTTILFCKSLRNFHLYYTLKILANFRPRTNCLLNRKTREEGQENVGNGYQQLGCGIARGREEEKWLVAEFSFLFFVKSTVLIISLAKIWELWNDHTSIVILKYLRNSCFYVSKTNYPNYEKLLIILIYIYFIFRRKWF